MSMSKAPSTLLLRALMKPSSTCASCQVRTAANYMPKTRYHKPNRLDKFHRQQRKALREEKQATHDRAATMTVVPPSPATQEQSSTSSLSNPSSQVPTSSSLPFTILRTTTQNIPVYETSKAGGSKHITQIRRTSGDLDAMASEIRKVLGLAASFKDMQGRKKENVTINRLTGHIIVRGWRGAEVKKWAEALGF